MATAASTNTAITAFFGQIPYAPRSANAKGIVAPLLRASGHLLFLLAHLTIPASETHTPLTEAEVQKELDDAKAHLIRDDFPDLPTLSITAKTRLSAFASGVTALANGWPSLTADQRIALLRDAANRAAALGSFLDQELTGITAAATDPGSSL